MGTRVRIMDMEVDLMTRETFQAAVAEYLTNEYLNVIHMISLDYTDMYERNELVREVLAEADIILPGEKAILSAHHVDILETGGMLVDYTGLLEQAEALRLKEKTFYLVVRNKKEARAVYGYFTRHLPKEHVLGVHAMDGDVTEEALINDINTKLPDIILLSMDSTRQEEWLRNHKGKLNAKLCFVVGSILPLIMRENVHVPAWLKKLHLGGIFRRIVKFPYSHEFRKRIFHRKMDDYNTKKKQGQ